MNDAPAAVFNPVLPEGFELDAEEPKIPRYIPDGFVTRAKTYVVENYNQHHDVPLSIDDMQVLWFAKVVSNWKALVTSPEARGMIWLVTNNASRQEVYIEIFKKINNIKISTRKVRT